MRFGRLTIIKTYYKQMKTRKRKFALCKCDCGNNIEVRYDCLMNDNTKSCGCYNKDRITKHGKYGTKLYKAWRGMKDRCYNIHDNHYKDWGKRGIKVCNEWIDDFQAFYKWAVDNGYRSDLTIDRINVNRNYEPDNCRWVDMKTQNRNKRNTKYITYKGETKSLAEWCEVYNSNYQKVWNRLRLGWSIERALRS